MSPNFGYEKVGTRYDMTYRGELVACHFTCPEDGTADSISAYLDWIYVGSVPVRFAIYRHSDNKFIAATEEILVGGRGWFKANFTSPKPSLIKGTEYWLVVFPNAPDTGLREFEDPAEWDKSVEQTGLTYPNFPDPLIVTGHFPRIYSIFCSYTPGAPPPTHTLTIISSAGGTTDPAPGAYIYDEGAVVRVTAYPATGYLFDHWELDGVVRTENPIDVLMDADHKLYAVFVAAPPPPTHRLRVESTPISGVPVNLDGSPMGNTPVQTDVREGTHEVEVPEEVEI